MELIGNVKNYDWGKKGNESLVAELAVQNSKDFKVDPKTPYAELWMGDHPSGPSLIKSNGKELHTLRQESLPFLFKVLSIKKALSIQVHPNKEEAQRLNKEQPNIYKDPNHKPELAVALTPFMALCGFRPYNEIWQFIIELPPLKALLYGDRNVESLKISTPADLRKIYEILMTCDADSIANCIEDISDNHSQVLATYDLLEVFCTVKQDFPGDVGVLCLFFLNLLRLQPGKAIFLAANEIHAYLSGDCIECMACSDNVIRAGLTPKYKDTAQLISCLNYTGRPANNKLFEPFRIDDHLQIFFPPVEDFVVWHLILPPSREVYKLQIQPFSSILITLQGERTLRVRGPSDVLLKKGSIVYIPSEAAPELEFFIAGNTRDQFVAYIAMYNCFKS